MIIERTSRGVAAGAPLGRTIGFMFCAATLCVSACGKPAMSAGPPAAPAAAEQAPAIHMGEKFKLVSKVLGEERQYWVHAPPTYRHGRPASTSYPVLYLIDGESHFQSAVATVDFLTGLAMIPEMIVVAVVSTDQRERDLTPTHSTKGPHGEVNPRIANSGGGERFERFLESELIPKIDSTYPTIPLRVVIGHSLGGLLTLHAALKEPPPFQAIIAMDPSLWWDEQALVKQAGPRLAKPDARLKSIYLSTGALPLDNGEDDNEGRAATQAFAAILTRSASSTFRAKFQVFAHDNHQSVAFPSLYEGLLFTFDGYKIATSEVIDDTSRIDAHYRRLSERWGVELRPPQRLIDLVSYTLLFERNKVDDAVRLLERNAKGYPNSTAAHDHLGRAYLVKGDMASARRCFERVLELDPNDEDARAEIVKLRKGHSPP
jgi:hypothetical protein